MQVYRLFGALVACGALLAVGCDDDDDDDTTGPGPQPTSFSATLNGANERPNPVTTSGTGTATFTVSGTQMTFTLNATGLTNVTAAHIHAGKAAGAGGIIVNLLATTPPAGPFSGQLSTGTITEASIGTAIPLSFAGLLALIRAGDTYVNVHTSANPGGEIRGQITAAP